MAETNRVIYCSQCKNSLYVNNERYTGGKNMLKCSRCKEAKVNKYIPTNSTYASSCIYFDPERKKDALKSNTAINTQMYLARKQPKIC